MGRHDWYRQTTWTDVHEKEFFIRFNRARIESNKAQYLVIQAGYLIDSGNSEYLSVALKLIDQMLVEYPIDTFIAGAHYSRGRALAALHRFDDAISAYRDSFAAERAYPNVKHIAYIDFAWMVVRNSLLNVYDEALAILDEFTGAGEAFPVNAYRAFTARALIWAHKNDLGKAQQFAQNALASAALTQSPFQNHRKLGIVKDPDQVLYSTLLNLASQTI